MDFAIFRLIIRNSLRENGKKERKIEKDIL